MRKAVLILCLMVASALKAEPIYVPPGSSDNIQAAIDSCPWNGCKIVLGRGFFFMRNAIRLKDGVHLEGESRAGTYLVAGNEFPDDTLMKMDGPYIKWGSVSNLTLKVEGNNLDVVALDISGARYWAFENLNIHGNGTWSGTAIKMEGAVPDSTFFNQFSNIDAGQVGFWKTGVKIDTRTSQNMSHIYFQNLVLRAEIPFDIESEGPLSMVFLGCYIAGNLGVSQRLFATQQQEERLYSLTMLSCTGDPKYFAYPVNIAPLRIMGNSHFVNGKTFIENLQ